MLVLSCGVTGRVLDLDVKILEISEINDGVLGRYLFLLVAKGGG